MFKKWHLKHSHLSKDRWLIGMASLAILICGSLLLDGRIFMAIRDDNQSEVILGQVRNVKEDVRFKPQASWYWTPTKRTQSVRAGDSLFTGPRSSSVVTLKNGSDISIGEDTLIVFDHLANETLPRLKNGNFLVKINGQTRILVNNEVVTLSGANSSVQIFIDKNNKVNFRTIQGSPGVDRQPLAPERKVSSTPSAPLQTPTLLYPPQNQIFRLSPYQEQRAVTIVGRSSGNDPVELEMEVARDESFQEIISRDRIKGDRTQIQTSSGNYYWRARAARNQESSAWSQTGTFEIQQQALSLPSLHQEFPGQIYYPPRTDSAPGESAEAQLQALEKQQFQANYFLSLPRGNSQIELKVEGRESTALLSGTEWPREFWTPGTYGYQVRLTQDGFQPSPWSPTKRVQVGSLPPRPLARTSPPTSPDELGKVSVPLQWSSTFFTSSYELLISPRADFKRTTGIYVRGTQYSVGIVPGRVYYWKVRSLAKDNAPLTDYSSVEEFVIEPEQVPIQQAQVQKNRTPSSLPDAALRMDSGIRRSLIRKIWGWVGSGYHTFKNSQTINPDSSLRFSSVNEANLTVQVGAMSEGPWGGLISYNQSPGKIKDPQAILNQSDYTWKTLSVEAIYETPWSFQMMGAPVTSRLRAGVMQQTAPYLNLNILDELDLYKTELRMATVGWEFQRSARNWNYSLFLRYLHTIGSKQSSRGSLDIEGKPSFDGTLGLSYGFLQNYRLGLFYQQQWTKYGFTYSDSTITNRGTNSFEYSNMDLRFGFDF